MTDQEDGRLWCLEIKKGLEFLFPRKARNFLGVKNSSLGQEPGPISKLGSRI